MSSEKGREIESYRKRRTVSGDGRGERNGTMKNCSGEIAAIAWQRSLHCGRISRFIRLLALCALCGHVWAGRPAPGFGFIRSWMILVGCKTSLTLFINCLFP